MSDIMKVSMRKKMDLVKGMLDHAGMDEADQFAVLLTLKDAFFSDAVGRAIAGAFCERLLELDSGDIFFLDNGTYDIKSLKMANRINEGIRTVFPEEWLQEYKDRGIYEKWAAEEESS